jgi:hopanoid biosynthesis associated RND transporter like protein HpnN
MSARFQELLGKGAAALVETSSTRPRLALTLCALLTAGSVYATVTILKVDTDSERVLSSELPVRQTNIAIAEAFPELQNNLIVMLDADVAGDARAAAEELSSRLAEEPERYPNLFLPGDAPYYDDFGLYHLDREDLDDVAARVEQAGPLLAALAEQAQLPILLGALSQLVGGVDGLSSLGADGTRILDGISVAVEAFNAGEHAEVSWDDLLFDDIGEGSHENPQLLFVRPVGDLDELEPVLEAMAEIRALAGELSPRPGLRVRITGDRAVHSEEMSLIVGEAVLSGALSLVLVTLILFVCLRSIQLVAVTVLTLLVGLSWTAGIAALAVGELNALTSAFAVIYIGLAVDFGIHFGLGYRDQSRAGLSPILALRGAGERVGSSLVLCALTTAIGFYAFIPTAYSGVADMGIISGTGVILGLLATLTLYPALIALGLGEKSGAAATARDAPRTRLPAFPIRHPRAVCGVAALLTLFCLASLQWVRFDMNPMNVRDPRVESVQALGELLGDSERSAWTIDVLAPNLDEALEAAAQIEVLGGVDHVNTVMSFLPDDQPARLAIFDRMRSDLEAPVELSELESGVGLDRRKRVEYTIEGYAVALYIDADLRAGEGDDDPLVQSAERLRDAFLQLDRQLRDEATAPELDVLEADLFGEIPELLEDLVGRLPTRRVGVDDLPSELRLRYLAPDGRARVEVFSADDLEAPGALGRFTDLVHSVRPDAGGPAAGTVALGRAIVESLRQALATAVVVIAILLLVLSRSAKYTLITMIPLLIGSVATAAVSVFADIPFNFANIIVLPLILGIGVDSGIHLVHRHRMGEQEGGSLLTTSTANAVLFSALTTGASFATLVVSNHLGISSLAQMLTTGIALMLAANIIVLPSVLVLVDGGAPGEAKGNS